MSQSRAAEARPPLDGRRGRVRARPTRFGGIAALVVVVALQLRGASVSPDGALTALVWSSLAGLVVIGWVWPWVALRSVTVEITDSPTDSVAGRMVTIGVRSRSRGLLNTLDVSVETRSVAVAGAAQPMAPDGESRLDVVTAERGVVDSLDLILTTDAPLGMVRAVVRRRVPLPRPIAVGPEIVRPTAPIPSAPESGEDQRSSPAIGQGDVVRTVRPYRAGDPAHLVHWPTSARTGTLVVRELEPPLRPGLVLIVHLRGRSAAVEQAVSEAAGRALAVIEAGGVVLLCTNANQRPVSGEVETPLHLSRRLAAAGVGEPGRPAAGIASRWPTLVVDP